MRCVLFIALLCCASSLGAKVAQDTMPFLVMPDGQKVMATHVLKFPLKREASGLAYDSVTNQFITCFDKGIPQLATFRLTDTIEALRQLEIKGDTTYYDLEGVDVQRSDSIGIRLKLCGERVLRDSLPLLTLRCRPDSCWHDSAVQLVCTFEPGVNSNWEGIGLYYKSIFLVKERDPVVIGEFRGEPFDGLYTGGLGRPFGLKSDEVIPFFKRRPSFANADSARIMAASKIAFSALCFDEKGSAMLAINRRARTILIYDLGDCQAFYGRQARYELVDHPLEWTGADTGDLLYGLVEGLAIGQVNGVRSLVMITDPGYGNYPKIVVFPWVYTYPDDPQPEN